MMDEMSTNQTTRLSLVAQFDDLYRYNEHVLKELQNGSSVLLIAEQLQKQKQLHKSILEENRILADAKQKLESENRSLTARLKHFKVLVNSEIEKNSQLRKELKNMEKRMNQIRDLVLACHSEINEETNERLVYLNASSMELLWSDVPKKYNETNDSLFHSMANGISFDDTADMDDVEIRNPETDIKNNEESNEETGEQISKKGRDVQRNSILKTNIEKVILEPNEQRVTFARNNNSFEATSILDEMRTSDSNFKRLVADDDNADSQDSAFQGFTQSRNFVGLRIHKFSVTTTARLERCVTCGSAMRSQHVQCQSCNAQCHIECKDRMPLPCVPVSRAKKIKV